MGASAIQNTNANRAATRLWTAQASHDAAISLHDSPPQPAARAAGAPGPAPLHPDQRGEASTYGVPALMGDAAGVWQAACLGLTPIHEDNNYVTYIGPRGSYIKCLAERMEQGEGIIFPQGV
jgi:hypothetical protein